MFMESIPLDTIPSSFIKIFKHHSVFESIGQEGDRTKVKRDKTEQHRQGG